MQNRGRSTRFLRLINCKRKKTTYYGLFAEKDDGIHFRTQNMQSTEYFDGTAEHDWLT